MTDWAWISYSGFSFPFMCASSISLAGRECGHKGSCSDLVGFVPYGSGGDGDLTQYCTYPRRILTSLHLTRPPLPFPVIRVRRLRPHIPKERRRRTPRHRPVKDPLRARRRGVRPQTVEPDDLPRRPDDAAGAFWVPGYTCSVRLIIIISPHDIELFTHHRLLVFLLACSAAPGVLAAVQKALAATGSKSVFITGHSLGAAIALLDNLYLPLHLPAGITFSSSVFGLPRVGNPAFANYGARPFHLNSPLVLQVSHSPASHHGHSGQHRPKLRAHNEQTRPRPNPASKTPRVRTPFKRETHRHNRHGRGRLVCLCRPG